MLALPPHSRVLVALSGGVDSSVAAGLLREAGHEVIGVTLHLWDAQGQAQVGRCCAPEDRDDARRTCEALGVPHYVLDEREAFRARVVDPFIDDNLAGSTPSPCVHCNQHVKLGRLGQLAERFGASHVATGHYARLGTAPDGGPRLLRGCDEHKDQSYFLFGVGRDLLSRLCFPLGELTKAQTREHGRRLGLPNWNKPDSQALCFVPDGDVRGFIEGRRADAGRPGPVLDEHGQALGTHAGIEGFTVGQRRGVRLPGKAPRYVLSVVPESNAVVVGPDERLWSRRFAAERASWIGHAPSAPFEASVRIRHRHAPRPAKVSPGPRGFEVELDAPERAIARGQAAVVYRGDEVLGGGFIA